MANYHQQAMRGRMSKKIFKTLIKPNLSYREITLCTNVKSLIGVFSGWDPHESHSGTSREPKS